MRKLILEAPYHLKMVTDAPIPEPGENQVRVHVKKIGICGSDPTIYKGLHPYVTYPVVMGHEIGAVIDKVGANVPESRVGERVAIIPHIVCGHCDACKHEIYNFCEELKCTGAEADGAHCDYFCIDACMAIPMPDTATLEQAAEYINRVSTKVKAVAPEMLIFVQGLPVQTPEDTQYIYDHTDAVGFIGINNMDYGTKPIQDTVAAFKSAKIHA